MYMSVTPSAQIRLGESMWIRVLHKIYICILISCRAWCDTILLQGKTVGSIVPLIAETVTINYVHILTITAFTNHFET